MNSVELRTISTISTLATNSPMRFILLFLGCSARLALAAAPAVARARIAARRRGRRGRLAAAPGRRGGGWPRRDGRLLQQPVERQVQQVGVVAVVDHHLADA